MGIKYKKINKKRIKSSSKVQIIKSISVDQGGKYEFGKAYCCGWCDYDVWEWYKYCPVCGKKLVWDDIKE